jgi:hypothetical protein
MDFSFFLMTCMISMISSRPKEGAGSCFKFVRCSNDLKTQKVYFSPLGGVYVGLIMLALVQVSSWSAGVWGISSRIGPC